MFPLDTTLKSIVNEAWKRTTSSCYRPHPKDGEGNVFSLSTPGGVPISHNALQHFPECHGAGGGVPCQVQPGGGVPCQVQLGGYPGWGDTLVGGTLAGGVPWPGGYPGQGEYPGQQGTQLGCPPSQVRMEGYPAGGVPWPGVPR